jgi:murein DD-endopeptidase MepM/ murein hydrolase activator NlpD
MPDFIWPLDSPIVTRDFFFKSPIYIGSQHAALDIICGDRPTTGAPVYAIADGTLIARPYDSQSGYNVQVFHADGWVSGYRHFRELIWPVNTPVALNQGRVIGYADSTGNVTGPHLHFDLWNTSKQDETAFYKVGYWAHDPTLYLGNEEDDLPYTEEQLKAIVRGVVREELDGYKDAVRQLTMEGIDRFVRFPNLPEQGIARAQQVDEALVRLRIIEQGLP